MRSDRSQTTIRQSQVDGAVNTALGELQEMDLPSLFSRLREIVNGLDETVSGYQGQLESRNPDIAHLRELGLMNSLDEARTAIPRLERLVGSLETYKAAQKSPDAT